MLSFWTVYLLQYAQYFHKMYYEKKAHVILKIFIIVYQ